jgi:hypothetical protein
MNGRPVGSKYTEDEIYPASMLAFIHFSAFLVPDAGAFAVSLA